MYSKMFSNTNFTTHLCCIYPCPSVDFYYNRPIFCASHIKAYAIIIRKHLACFFYKLFDGRPLGKNFVFKCNVRVGVFKIFRWIVFAQSEVA